MKKRTIILLSALSSLVACLIGYFVVDITLAQCVLLFVFAYVGFWMFWKIVSFIRETGEGKPTFPKPEMWNKRLE